LRTALLEIVISVGGYYLLRAFGVGVFWALTAPAIAVAVVAVTVTVRRRHVDMIGLLVFCELAATVVLSLATQSAVVAAMREPVYVFIVGVFCLVTLFGRLPFSHVGTAAIATFGDERRARAFDHAWRNVPRYRMWQRLITVSFGMIMTGGALVRAYVLYVAPDERIAHAVDVSNIIGLVTFGAVVRGTLLFVQVRQRVVLPQVPQDVGAVLLPLRCQRYLLGPSVRRVRPAFDQALLLQPVDDERDVRRLAEHPGRQLARGDRRCQLTQHDHLGGGDAQLVADLPDVGVEPVRQAVYELADVAVELGVHDPSLAECFKS
jgi:hypothetical protein